MTTERTATLASNSSSKNRNNGRDSWTRRRLNGAAPLLGGAGWLLAACGESGTQGSSLQSAPPATVRFATDWLSGPRGETMKLAIPAFQERYPNIKVAVESITGDYFTAINTQLAAGTVQEVVLFEGNFFESYKDQNAFAAIDPALKQQNVRMADYTVVPGIYQHKGKQYGMPFQLVCSGWFYNVDLFEAGGVKPPNASWTWDDVLAAAQALTKPERGQYGIHVTNNDQFGWGPLLFSAGARWHNADKTKTLLTEQGGPEAFQWVVDLVHKHRVSPAPAQVKELRGEFSNPFLAGKVAMLPVGMQSVGGYANNIKDRFKWDIMPTPKHPKTKKATHVWNDQPHIVMNTAAKNKVVDQATALVIFLAGDVTQGRIAVDRGSIPVLKKLQTSPDYLKPPPANMRQVSENLKDPDIQTPGYLKGWEQWQQAYSKELDKAFAGEIAPQQALRNAVTAADAVLARIGPQK